MRHLFLISIPVIFVACADAVIYDCALRERPHQVRFCAWEGDKGQENAGVMSGRHPIGGSVIIANVTVFVWICAALVHYRREHIGTDWPR
jgi:hypothetical protein